jgi:TIGR03009 family protein
MRLLFALAALMTASSLAAAQQQGAPANGTPAPAGDAAQLDAVLGAWETTLASVKSLQAECDRTVLDKTFQSTEVLKGIAKYLKVPGPGQGSRASLELHKQTPKGPSATIFEKYVCTGTYLYQYVPAKKVILVYDLPAPKTGQIPDDNFLSFLFGMKAQEAKERYQLSLTPSDKYYHYVLIQPKLAQDKAEFTRARLVLRRDNFLPAQVWFHRPNGNEETWNFQARRDVTISPAEFAQPTPPPGWQFERVRTEAKIRGSGS